MVMRTGDALCKQQDHWGGWLALSAKQVFYDGYLDSSTYCIAS